MQNDAWKGSLENPLAESGTKLNMHKLEMDVLKYSRKLEALVRSEAELRTIARKVLKEVFTNTEALSNAWNILPTQYVTIPLQATIYLGALERKHKRKKRIASTKVINLFQTFCESKEGHMLSRATFADIISADKVPRFSTLGLIQLHKLIELSIQELKPYIQQQDLCTSQAHPTIAGQ